MSFYFKYFSCFNKNHWLYGSYYRNKQEKLIMRKEGVGGITMDGLWFGIVFSTSMDGLQ